MTVAGAPHSGLWGRRIQQVAAAAALFAVGAAIALGCRRQAGAQSKPATYINGTAAVWDGDSLTVRALPSGPHLQCSGRQVTHRTAARRCRGARCGCLPSTRRSCCRRARTRAGARTPAVGARPLLWGPHAPVCARGEHHPLMGAAGKVAADALRALVGSASLSCVVVRADRYRRSVARCTRAATFFRRAVDLGEWLLENGHALVYRCAPVSRAPAYRAACRCKHRPCWRARAGPGSAALTCGVPRQAVRGRAPVPLCEPGGRGARCRARRLGRRLCAALGVAQGVGLAVANGHCLSDRLIAWLGMSTGAVHGSGRCAHRTHLCTTVTHVTRPTKGTEVTSLPRPLEPRPPKLTCGRPPSRRAPPSGCAPRAARRRRRTHAPRLPGPRHCLGSAQPSSPHRHVPAASAALGATQLPRARAHR